MTTAVLALLVALVAPPPTTSPPDQVVLQDQSNVATLTLEKMPAVELTVVRVDVPEVTLRLDRAPSAEVVSVFFLPQRDVAIAWFDMNKVGSTTRRFSPAARYNPMHMSRRNASRLQRPPSTTASRSMKLRV